MPAAPPQSQTKPSFQKSWWNKTKRLYRPILYGLILLIVIASIIFFYIHRTAATTTPANEHEKNPYANTFDPPETDRVIQGYLTSWSAYTSFNISMIPANQLTHITYAFAVINAAGRIEIADAHIDHKNFDRLNKFKRKYSHLQTLISVGGYVGIH